jgi:transposase-like protein
MAKDTRVNDAVLEGRQRWLPRPLQCAYAATFIDAIYVERAGPGRAEFRNQPFHAAIGGDLAGHRALLGLWTGHGGGEAAQFAMFVLTDCATGACGTSLRRLRWHQGNCPTRSPRSCPR